MIISKRLIAFDLNKLYHLFLHLQFTHYNINRRRETIDTVWACFT